MRRARALIHKHLDLRVVLGERLNPDAERVTRPILSSYEALPTLLSGAVTLCKAQARLRDLVLERVLLTGGGSQATGLAAVLGDRMRVPVELWNLAAELDCSDLPAEDAARLQEDGPAASLAIGLALTAANPDLYALEILTAGARRKRDFSERGIWAVLAGVVATAFLGLAFWQNGRLADDSQAASRRALGQVSAVKNANARTTEILAKVTAEEALSRELATHAALGESARRFLDFIEGELPESLWVETWSLRLESGKDWGRPANEDLPVVEAAGRSEEDSRVASQQFSEFSGKLQAFARGGEVVKPVTRPQSKELEWSLKAMLLAPPDADATGAEAKP